MRCQHNLRQVGLALQGFQAAHRNFPGGATAAIGMSSGGCDPEEVEVEDNPGKCTDFEA
jgi:hypothetical protein